MFYVLISVLVLVVAGVVIATMLRRVVPTNMVHIVQSTKKRAVYGSDKPDGNTYYEFPAHIPLLGVSVTTFPESIFNVNLNGYDAYDAARLPFVVDVVAFFRVADAGIVAQRVAHFQELNDQLKAVVQGAVRRILATNTLEDIMESRASLGKAFTDEVQEQIKEWGVLPVKTIEFMDLRDSSGSKVIENIMAKEQSRISKESRIKVAENNKDAQLKEIEATQLIGIQAQLAEEQIGKRTAEKELAIGVAKELATQEVKIEAAITMQKEMDVKRISETNIANIAKEVAVVIAAQDKEVAEVRALQDKQVKITDAEASKAASVMVSEGNLAASKNEAAGTIAIGEAKAKAETAMLLAPVDTQIKLASEIGSNKSYQEYLIAIRQVDVSKDVGIELAKAMQGADLKIIANAGDVQTGINKLGDLFTPAGGTNLTGMLAALAQTGEGKAIIGKFTGKQEESS